MKPQIKPRPHWKFPTPQVLAVPGGLNAWVFDVPGQHVAAFELIMPAPLDLEPRAAEGVAQLAVHASDEGTTSHPHGRIAELLEMQGAALHGAAGYWYSRLGGDAPVRRLQQVSRLFAEVIREPAFDERHISHHVELQLAAFRSREASPGAMASKAFRESLYGTASRRGRPLGGTPETIQALHAGAVHDWHDKNWARPGATFVLTGDLANTDLDSVLSPLADLSRGESAPQPTPSPPPSEPEVVLVDMPAAVQATVQVGCQVPGRRHPDWAALKLAGHVLAGAFASRLNLELRERRGFTYGISGGVSAQPIDGRFLVSGSFRTEVAAEAIARIREEIPMPTPISDEEAADARRFLVGIAPLANETATQITRQASVLAGANESPGFVNEHFTELERVSAEQATRALRQHVRPENLTIAISGSAADLEPRLTAAGLSPRVISRRAL